MSHTFEVGHGRILLLGWSEVVEVPQSTPHRDGATGRWELLLNLLRPYLAIRGRNVFVPSLHRQPSPPVLSLLSYTPLHMLTCLSTARCSFHSLKSLYTAHLRHAKPLAFF